MEILNSLVLPCYNEEQNLVALRSEFLPLPELIEGEVILVNNGSSDRTGDVIAELHQENSNIVSITVKENIGYGFGILSGLRATSGKYVGWTHADGQMNLKDAVSGFSMMWTKDQPENFFVMGRRRGRPGYERLFEFGMSAFESTLFGAFLNDITAQPKIMSRAFFEGWEDPPNDFSLDLYAYLMAKKTDRTVLKFDTEYHRRAHGASSWNTGLASRIKLIRRTIAYSWQLRQKLDKA